MKFLNLFFLFLVKIYQKCLSPFLGHSCRYYPSCSNYACWVLEKQNFIRAIFSICIRILSCNSLFKGGIQYPIIKKNNFIKHNLIIPTTNMINPSFWLIPIKNDKFYLIKKI